MTLTRSSPPSAASSRGFKRMEALVTRSPSLPNSIAAAEAAPRHFHCETEMLPLKDPQLLTTRCLVNGQWVDARSGNTIDVTNPATGELVARVPTLSAEEVEEVIVHADAAFRPWAKRPAKERSA